AVEGALAIRVVQPAPDSPRPAVDSTFIYGSVGTGGAALMIGGAQVPVAPNGAFIAYLPLPEDGTWRLTAYRGGERAEASVSYRPPSPTRADSVAAGAGTLPQGVFPRPAVGVVARGGDTLATGSDAVFARPTPTGTYRWFWPLGTRLALVERRGAQYRVQLDTASAWIDTVAVRVDPAAVSLVPARLAGEVAGSADGAEIRVAAGYAPFLVTTTDSAVSVTVYRSGAPEVQAVANDFVRGAAAAPAGAGSATFTASLSRRPWGYRAFHRPDGTLVVRVRRPPAIDSAAPLRGIHVVVDPGHPPAGATGPTGVYEGDANLATSLRLAEKLRSAGAQVTLTRTTRDPLRSATSAAEELRARAELAVASGAHLMVSVHNNAFGEGQNPFRAHHTSTYYFHPFSAGLARALNEEIAPVAQIPNRGALVGNFAVIRPTWLPTALTESLFMPIPEQEAALTNAEFADRLAQAHLRGIAAFLRRSADR
ncbi:MAG TPA: N-acetylmuramoyl-L-alanine amidase, partial [Longimicrobiaceae bacterium]|nr:N-acetylmuramoyl-L-alanine amidase [Longimicrobiaceae bacterium]